MNRFAGVCCAVILVVGPLATRMLADEPTRGATLRATSEQVKGLFSAANVCADRGLSDSGRGDRSRKLTTNGYAENGNCCQSAYIARGADESPIIELIWKRSKPLVGFMSGITPDQGSQVADIEEFANIQIEVVLQPEAALQLLERLERDLFARFAMIAYATELEVIRSEKF